MLTSGGPARVDRRGGAALAFHLPPTIRATGKAGVTVCPVCGEGRMMIIETLVPIGPRGDVVVSGTSVGATRPFLPLPWLPVLHTCIE